MVGPTGVPLFRQVIDGPGEPGMDAVDRVARLRLVAHRFGGTLRIDEVAQALQQLFEFTGLELGE